MDFKGVHVLMLEGYARQSLPFIRAFKQQGCKVAVLCDSKLDIAYVSRLPDEKILGICNTERYVETANYVRELLASRQFDLVVPLVDFSARLLSENKEEFVRYARIASNDWDVFNKAQDKLEVMRICMEHEIPCPITLFGVNGPEDIYDSGIKFPLVIKPRRECGARGFHLFQSEEELRLFLKEHTIDFSQCVVQEFIPQNGANLSGNLFIDNDGVVKSSFVYASYRWFPLKGGTGTLNGPVNRPDVVERCTRLAEILRLRGCNGFDLVQDSRDGIAKIIEINPRIMACAKIGFCVGIDLARQILEKEFGETVCEYTGNGLDKYIRMSQTDLLWFLKSPDRFRATPSWFSQRNTIDQTFSLDDPLPWFAFFLRGLLNYKKELSKRR